MNGDYDEAMISLSKSLTESVIRTASNRIIEERTHSASDCKCEDVIKAFDDQALTLHTMKSWSRVPNLKGLVEKLQFHLLNCILEGRQKNQFKMVSKDSPSSDSSKVTCQLCYDSQIGDTQEIRPPGVLRINLEVPLDDFHEFVHVKKTANKYPEVQDFRQNRQNSFKRLETIKETGSQTMNQTNSGTTWLRESLRMKDPKEAFSRVASSRGDLDWSRLEELEKKSWNEFTTASQKSLEDGEGSLISYLKILFTTIEQKKAFLKIFMPKLNRLQSQIKNVQYEDSRTLFKLTRELTNLYLVSGDLDLELDLLKSHLSIQAVYSYEMNKKIPLDRGGDQPVVHRIEMTPKHFGKQLRVLIELSNRIEIDYKNLVKEFCEKTGTSTEI